MTELNPLLEVQDLKTYFFTSEGVVKAVDGVDFSICPGETFCLVGESGCGKSVTAFSITQIVQRPGRIVSGHIYWQRDDGSVCDLAVMSPKGKALRSIRGREIAMVFQEPMSSLSPVHTIGDQISEAFRLHFQVDKAQARKETIATLKLVGIPKPERAFDSYTFQLSGGMRQRAMIAMALVCRPRLLIADEPTTALDVTMQAVILDLIKELQQELGMAVMLITHNLGVVAEVADKVAVMYLGRIVESADVHSLFLEPKHPYTMALLRSIPKLGSSKKERLATIRGMVPHPFNRPSGCTFYPRCDYFIAGTCDRVVPPITRLDGGRIVRCFLYNSADHQ